MGPWASLWNPEGSLVVLGTSLESFGGALGRPWGVTGSAVGRPWDPLGSPWGSSGTTWGVLKPLGLLEVPLGRVSWF